MDDILPIFKALADPMRLAVFECIRGCGGAAGYDMETGLCDGGTEGGIAACEIRCRVPCKPSTLTHHLNVLRKAGLIETEKRGRIVYAHILPSTIERLAVFCKNQVK